MSFYTGTQVECLYAMPSAATAVTAAAQTLLSHANAGTAAGGAFQLPAGYFAVGANGGQRSLLLKGGGFFSVGSTAVTDTFQVALTSTSGTYSAGGLLAATGAFTTTASVTNGAFEFEVMVTAQATGVSAGVLSAVGHLLWGAGANASAPVLSAFSSSAAPAIMIGAPNSGLTSVNTQAAYFVELFNTWSATTGAPTITLTNFLVLGLN